MESIGKIIGIFALLLGSVISRAFATTLIWNMFVPQFFGLRPMPVLIAMALSALLAVLMPTPIPKEDKEAKESDLYRLFALSYILPWASYLVTLIATTIYF